MSGPVCAPGTIYTGQLTPVATPGDFNLCKPKPDAPAGWKLKGRILVPSEFVPDDTRLRRMPYKSGKPVEMRIVVDIRVHGKLNMKLWDKLKLPAGWRKAPRLQWKNDNNFPVRLYSYEPRSLSAEDLTNIQGQLSLMETT